MTEKYRTPPALAPGKSAPAGFLKGIGPGVIIPAVSLPRGTRVVNYERVSESSQERRGSLERRLDEAWRFIKGAGLKLVARAYGSEYGQIDTDRPHLLRAIDHARRHRVGIITTDLSRLIRSAAFDKETNWKAVPTPEEIEALLRLVEGVPFLATIAHPASSPKEIHRLAVKRGMTEGGNPGGRPSSIDSRKAERIRAGRAAGETLGQLAEKHKVSRSAVQRVLRKG